MKRRDLFKAAALGAAACPLAAAFGAKAAAPPAPARFKITDVRVVNLRLVKELGVLEQRSASPPLRYRSAIGGGSFTEVRTDQGLTGIGPGVDPPSLAFAKALLVGEDPFDITDHALKLYNPGRRGGGAVELALWDLIGKATGQPLYKLWGGVVSGVQTTAGRNTVTPYASQWTLGQPEERGRMAALVKSQGFKAMKMRLGYATLKEDVALIEAARKAGGDDFLIMCDGNKAGPYGGGTGWPVFPWDYTRAVETARALRPLGLTWLEEPLPRFDYDQLADLRRLHDVPIAGGENNLGINEFLTAMQKGCFDYVQPEVLAIGPTMLRAVGVLAAAYDVKISPHGGSGGVSWIGLMHLICSMPNAPFIELVHEPPVAPFDSQLAIFTNPPVMKDGVITVPDGPGLGVTINPDLILKV